MTMSRSVGETVPRWSDDVRLDADDAASGQAAMTVLSSR